jgi:hypothetical protein
MIAGPIPGDDAGAVPSCGHERAGYDLDRVIARRRPQLRRHP